MYIHARLHFDPITTSVMSVVYHIMASNNLTGIALSIAVIYLKVKVYILPLCPFHMISYCPCIVDIHVDVHTYTDVHTMYYTV